jgi:hypothetical protein
MFKKPQSIKHSMGPLFGPILNRRKMRVEEVGKQAKRSKKISYVQRRHRFAEQKSLRLLQA